MAMATKAPTMPRIMVLSGGFRVPGDGVLIVVPIVVVPIVSLNLMRRIDVRLLVGFEN